MPALLHTVSRPLPLTHPGWVTHTCVSKLTIIGSDNGLTPGRRQTIIWTNDRILLIGPLGTYFSETLVKIYFHSRKCLWNCRQEIGDHFVSSSMCYPTEAKPQGPFWQQSFPVHFLYENHCVLNRILLKCAPGVAMNNENQHWFIRSLNKTMAYRLFGAKPLSYSII